MISAFSYAKVNLGLRIMGKRRDGYHEICSVFQTISLRDRLTFSERSDELLVLSCDDPSIPADARNLAVRAAELLRTEVYQSSPRPTRTLGATIRLYKKIPSGAGLGGGSSNAAVTLTALRKLWDLRRLPLSKLRSLAARIGSDVPFFLTGGTCLVTGRGENVSAMRPLPKFHLVVIFPGIHISTAWAYSRISLPLTNGPKYSKIMMREFGRASGPAGTAPLLVNDMEAAVIPRHPAIGRAKRDLMKAGALNSLMSGSGSAVFGIFEDGNSARKAWRLLSPRWPACHQAESVART